MTKPVVPRGDVLCADVERHSQTWMRSEQGRGDGMGDQGCEVVINRVGIVGLRIVVVVVMELLLLLQDDRQTPAPSRRQRCRYPSLTSHTNCLLPSLSALSSTGTE